MGSAQSRRAGYVLQHGSLPLGGDITRLIDVLDLDAVAAAALRRDLADRACTLAQALGVADDDPLTSFGRVSAAMRQGFEQSLNLQFKASQLTPGELRRTAQLIREQFANPAWTGAK
jgi:lipoate-protein ligase A